MFIPELVTVIVVVLLAERTGFPLSVAANTTLKVAPVWLGPGVNVNVPLAGFPGVDEKLIPDAKPVADSVNVFAGRSLSVPVTVKVRVVLAATVCEEGALTTGDVFTSFTVMVTLAWLVAPRLSVARNVTT